MAVNRPSALINFVSTIFKYPEGGWKAKSDSCLTRGKPSGRRQEAEVTRVSQLCRTYPSLPSIGNHLISVACYSINSYRYSVKRQTLLVLISNNTVHAWLAFLQKHVLFCCFTGQTETHDTVNPLTVRGNSKLPIQRLLTYENRKSPRNQTLPERPHG